MADLQLKTSGASQDSPSLLQTRAEIRIRSQASRFLAKALGCSLTATFGIIVLQGFHLWGFSLPEPFLNWLGGATIGQVGGCCLWFGVKSERMLGTMQFWPKTRDAALIITLFAPSSSPLPGPSAHRPRRSAKGCESTLPARMPKLYPPVRPAISKQS